MELPIYQVDAFAENVFRGNPAAVVPLDEWLDEELLQSIAAENNLSETAFIVPAGASSWEIRWFTPTVEVPLCGHATLASAAVLHTQLGHAVWPITLHSASGELRVDCIDNDFVVDLPANTPTPAALPGGLPEALGVVVRESHQAGDFYVIPLDTEARVAALTPDFSAIKRLTDCGVIVTAPGDSTDFVSRMFAPGMGIDEDPVTGAAHCILAPFWSTRLEKTQFRARQISARGGVLECELAADRVSLRGRACLYLSGTITV